MEIRQSYLKMIKAYPGGWDAMAAALGMSRDALENRIYERKGQSILVETAKQMQLFSGTSFFAEAVAQESGGVFLTLPESEEHDHDEMLSKFNELYAELGELSAKFKSATSDGEIDSRERADLTHLGQQIHRSVSELLALSFSIYCRKNKAEK